MDALDFSGSPGRRDQPLLPSWMLVEQQKQTCPELLTEYEESMVKDFLGQLELHHLEIGEVSQNFLSFLGVVDCSGDKHLTEAGPVIARNLEVKLRDFSSD
nr:uncharacterized protein LOC106844164 isoform X2 [Equus asinus]